MKKVNKIKWEDTCDRFIAYFDIMGFKDTVYRNPHEEVLKRMNRLSTFISEIKAYYEITPIEEIARGSGSVSGSSSMIDYDFSKIEIRPIMFSDSILFVPNNNTFDAAINILYSSAWFLSSAISEGIPLKGALAYGKFTADSKKSIYFGQPLIDAYELEGELELYGAILHHTAEEELENNGLLEPFLEDENLIKYKTPLKSGKINHYNLNWLKYPNNMLSEKESIIQSFERFYNKTSGKPRKYIDNTLEFINKL